MKDCPVCGVSLKEVSRYGALIDVCPTCRGVWLDHGELEKIISISRDFHNNMDDLEEHRRDYFGNRDHIYDRDYEHDYYRFKHHKKKRKSIFEEIFDIFD